VVNESQIDNKESREVLKTLIHSYDILEEKLLKIDRKIHKLKFEMK